MSVMEIPDELYRIIYAREVANALDNDPYHDLKAARQRAQEIMGHCFVSRCAQIQCESQKDYYEAEHEGDWTR